MVSALLFATLHLSPMSFLHLAIIGVILAEVRMRSGSIYPGMLIHAAYDGAIVLTAWWQ